LLQIPGRGVGSRCSGGGCPISTRLRRRWIYVVVGIGIFAVAAAGGFLLATGEERVRLTERSGVIEGARKAAKRFPVVVTERTSRIFVAARARSRTSPPNPFRAPPTPDDPTAEPVESAGLARAGEAAPSGSQDETSDRLAIFRETVVDDATAQTSHIAEPHVATDGTRALVVWNWGAARSLDGGQTFEKLAFEPSPYPFCCDQLAYYAPSHDLWIWILQYRGEGNVRKRNPIRLAYASGAAFANRDRPVFSTYDLAARDIAGLRQGETIDGDAYLDFVRIAATREHLFLTINMFPTVSGAFSGSVVVRVSLDELAARTPRADWHLASRRTTGLTSGATDAMYFASHRSTAELTVCRWEDDEANPACRGVTHSAYPDYQSGAYSCLRVGAEPTSDWCQRLTDGRPNQDDRPLSGWIADGVIGFSWNAKQDPQHGFPFPFTMVVRIDASALTVVDEPYIWHNDRAFQYAAITPNARGDLGGVALAGGGQHFQTCVALFRARDAPSESGWQMEVVEASTSDSVRAVSGDYLGIAPSAPGANTWAGSCMTLHGGGGEANVDIRYFTFGRTGDAR
jgi:hypothetical protein